MELSGSVVASGPGDVAGYVVTATTVATVDVGDGSTTLIPVGGSTRVRSDGSFMIRIALDGAPSGPVTFEVSAPDGHTLLRRSVDRVTRRLKLEVVPVKAAVVTAATGPSGADRPVLSGRVVDAAGRATPAHLPVVLWATRRDGGTAGPLVSTETEPGGMFTAPWPLDVLTAVEARVAGLPAVPLALASDGRLPRDLIVVVKLADAAVPDCACVDVPPRAPEPSSLTRNPTAYSQDLGGSCVDLSMPNRSIEEFTYAFVVRTTEPRVRALTIDTGPNIPDDLLTDLLGIAVAQHKVLGAGSSLRAGTGGPLRLGARAARHLVRADEAPTLQEVQRTAWLSETSRVHGLIDAALGGTGNGRVELDAADPIDWDATPTIHQAIEVAHGHLLQYREVWRADGYSLGDLLMSLPLAPMQRRRIAVVDWERRARSQEDQSLEFEEELDALLTRDRDVLEIVGTRLHEETEGGSRSTTWGVAGGIGAGYVDGANAIFGGVAGGYGRSDASAWQSSARTFSADSFQRLQDRVAQRSSSVRDQRTSVVQTVAQGETQRAETEVVANYNRCHAVTIQYFEVLRHFLVSHELADVSECLFVPFPMEPFDRAKALRWRDALRRRLRDPGPVVRRSDSGGRVVRETDLSLGFGALARAADDWVGHDYPQARYSEEPPESLTGELRISFTLPRPRDADDGGFDGDAWEGYRPLMDAEPGGVFRQALMGAQAAVRDHTYQRDIAPRIVENLVRRLRFAYVGPGGEETAIDLDATLVSGYREGVPLYITLNPAGPLPAVAREDIAYVKVWFNGDGLPPDARVVLRRARIRYQAAHSSDVLVNAERVLDDLGNGDPAVLASPLRRRERRDPRAEDSARAGRLVDHLNEHLEYYHQVMWTSLDAQRRYLLLDAVKVPGMDGLSVASVCANELIGIVGNSLVLPLAPGCRLDPTVVSSEAAPPLRDAYLANAPEALRVSLPTRGVFAEAVSGQCSACETPDDTRYWRWSTDGMLGPPEIDPIDTGTRATDEPDLSPTDLPAPLVSIQNAPAAPPPAGLAGAFELLAAKELFADVTSLEGSQKNAAGALEQSLTAAAALGTEAFGLAKQQEVSRDAERMVDRIVAAQADELLSADAARNLTGAVLRATVAPAAADTSVSSAEDPVQQAVESAAESSSASISVSSPAESVSVSFTDSGPVKAGHATTVAVTQTNPNWRACCALGQWLPPRANMGLDPSALAGHRYGRRPGGPTGYVYTATAGFIDLGHLRDLADMTKFVYDALMGGATRLRLYEGTAVVPAGPIGGGPAIELAGRIAYVESWAHELHWDDYSAFSPEDIPSNIAGIVVAQQALRVGGPFDAAVDAEVDRLLQELGAVTKAKTDAALDRTEGKWWERAVAVPPFRLLRRNFTGDVPWMVGTPDDTPQTLPFLHPSSQLPAPGEFTYQMHKGVSGVTGVVTLATMQDATDQIKAAWLATHPGTDEP